MLPRLLSAVLLTATTIVSSQAGAQHHPGSHGQHQERGAGASPYAGLETRSIKALSEQQMADLRAGRGMGFALAAELNGYPGPLHVVELNEQIGLTPDQRTRMEALYAAMKAETVTIGERLIQQEADLDRLFAARAITRKSLSAATSTIGTIQAELREAHLRYHLSTVEVLTPEQIARYNQLRGYQGQSHGRPHEERHERPR
jgi:Spy/CpxP family protein refolding chaperone